MNAGDLKNKLSIVEDIVEVSDSGFKVSTQKEIGTFRCKADFLSTRELYRLEQLNLKVSIKFTIRNVRPKLNEKQIIMFRGESYNITYFEEVYNNSKYLTIYANKVKGK